MTIDPQQSPAGDHHRPTVRRDWLMVSASRLAQARQSDDIELTGSETVRPPGDVPLVLDLGGELHRPDSKLTTEEAVQLIRDVRRAGEFVAPGCEPWVETPSGLAGSSVFDSHRKGKGLCGQRVTEPIETYVWRRRETSGGKFLCRCTAYVLTQSLARRSQSTQAEAGHHARCTTRRSSGRDPVQFRGSQRRCALPRPDPEHRRSWRENRHRPVFRCGVGSLSRSCLRVR